MILISLCFSDSRIFNSLLIRHSAIFSLSHPSQFTSGILSPTTGLLPQNFTFFSVSSPLEGASLAEKNNKWPAENNKELNGPRTAIKDQKKRFVFLSSTPEHKN